MALKCRTSVCTMVKEKDSMHHQFCCINCARQFRFVPSASLSSSSSLPSSSSHAAPFPSLSPSPSPSPSSVASAPPVFEINDDDDEQEDDSEVQLLPVENETDDSIEYLGTSSSISSALSTAPVMSAPLH